jgi:bifunctional UDP-N-acetylglucosamine pyrophosphorylase/glucosamine-1-phosphate N-acetyltransferase
VSEYDFDGERLVRVRQTREGDRTDPGGRSDAGLFGLPVANLCSDWDAFSQQAASGAATGEVNFLPFLPYLSCERARPVEIVMLEDADEARGVNTPDDLAFARAKLQLRSQPLPTSLFTKPVCVALSKRTSES